jgi:hypothetical protein
MDIKNTQGQHGFVIPAHISGEGSVPINAFVAQVQDEDTSVLLSKGFFSSDQGHTFAKIAEDLYRTCILPIIIEALPEGQIKTTWIASVITNFVLIVRRDGSFDFYAGQQAMQIEGKLHGENYAGRSITRDDYLDVKRITFPDIEFSAQDSVIVMHSDFLRHSLIFDLGRHETDFDVVSFSEYFARCYLEFTYPETYTSDAITRELEADGWFPFIGLRPTLYAELYQNYKESPEMRIKDSKLQDFFEPKLLRDMSEKWWGNALFVKHKDFVESALANYERDDYIASISTLYLRVEGVLRELYLSNHDKTNVPGSSRV